MTAHLVSIVVRTEGKRPRLLAGALRSLAAQTHPRLEILLVEDGSASLGGLAAEIEALRPHAVRHEPIPKSGRSAAGNIGFERASGAFLGLLDEDDELEPRHVELLLATLDQHPEADLAYARATPVACLGLQEDRAGAPRALPPQGDAPFSRTLLWLRNRIPIQAALFRRGLYERAGGFDTTLDLLEDWDLWLRYSAVTEFVALDAVTSSYRLPAEKEALLARAAAHRRWAERVAAKHRDLTAPHRFADIAMLPDFIRGEIPFRHAMALGGRALLKKLKRLVDGDE